MAAIAISALIAGCPEPLPGSPDAGGDDPDGAVGAAKLTLVVLGDLGPQDGVGGGEGGGVEGYGPLAGPIRDKGIPTPDNVDVTSVALTFENIRFIGDVAQAVETGVDFDWTAGAATSCLPFTSAAPGGYSQIEARLTGYRIEGAVTLGGGGEGGGGGTVRSFVIAESPPEGVMIMIEVGQRRVEPDSTTLVGVNFRSLVPTAAVDWTSFEGVEGDIVIDGSSPFAPGVRTALTQSFSAADQGVGMCPGP